ncbi:MAG: type II secretion system F family protein [Anaerolineae bacterium]|nr:type II secretion system F family protein [Anaerolineae bacterium]
MQNQGPLIFGLLVALCITVGFAALWFVTRPRDSVERRLEHYGMQSEALQQQAPKQRRRMQSGWLRGGLGPVLAEALQRADLPFTAVEYFLIILGMGVVGFLLGSLRMNVALGTVLALVFAYLPLLYLRIRRRKLKQALVTQLPDMLTLMVGALRAGYGLTQTLDMLVKRLTPPVSTELARVMRAVNLGLPVQNALRDMADRLDIDDIDLMVTAISVQYEMGGNLAQTLDIISETIRDRIRMLREIQVLTSEQRFTGYVLGMLPVVVAFILFMLNPEYMGRLFEPGWIRLVPVLALVMQILGFVVISRIVDIEV